MAFAHPERYAGALKCGQTATLVNRRRIERFSIQPASKDLQLVIREELTDVDNRTKK